MLIHASDQNQVLLPAPFPPVDLLVQGDQKDMQPHGLKFIKTFFSVPLGESISLWDVGPLNLQKPSVVRLRSINSSKVLPRMMVSSTAAMQFLDY